MGSGSNFSGSRWAMLSNLVGINIVVAAVDSHHTIGRVERNVQIVHKAYEAIHEASEGAFSPAETFTLALLARNMTPNSGCRIAALTALNGRPGFIDQFSKATVREAGGDRYDSEENSCAKRLLLVKNLKLPEQYSYASGRMLWRNLKFIFAKEILWICGSPRKTMARHLSSDIR